MAGDYVDDLGQSYTVTNGTLTATFTPEQLFAGQDDGTPHFAPSLRTPVSPKR